MGDCRFFTEWYLLSYRRVVGVDGMSAKEPTKAVLLPP